MTALFTAAVVPAAGVGLRMGGGTAKQFLPLLGLPILAHTLKLLQATPELDAIVVVTLATALDDVREIGDQVGCTKLAAVVSGGDRRQDSVFAGLHAVRALLIRGAEQQRCIVAVHDAARPLLPVPLLSGILQAAVRDPALVMAVPVKDTIKLADTSGHVLHTPPRSTLWAAQTPQVFDLNLLYRAYQQAADDGYWGTDDAELVERLGQPVHIFPGSDENLKLTTPIDLILAEAIMRRREH